MQTETYRALLGNPALKTSAYSMMLVIEDSMAALVWPTLSVTRVSQSKRTCLTTRGEQNWRRMNLELHKLNRNYFWRGSTDRKPQSQPITASVKKYEQQ